MEFRPFESEQQKGFRAGQLTMGIILVHFLSFLKKDKFKYL